MIRKNWVEINLMETNIKSQIPFDSIKVQVILIINQNVFYLINENKLKKFN